MIDQNGIEISSPRIIHLKVPLRRFDFYRKQRLLLKQIVTAESIDNGLVMTAQFPEQAAELPGWLPFHSSAHVDFKTGIRIVPFLLPPWSYPPSCTLPKGVHRSERLRESGLMDR